MHQRIKYVGEEFWHSGRLPREDAADAAAPGCVFHCAVQIEFECAYRAFFVYVRSYINMVVVVAVAVAVVMPAAAAAMS